jgi:hypothetical protein
VFSRCLSCVLSVLTRSSTLFAYSMTASGSMTFHTERAPRCILSAIPRLVLGGAPTRASGCGGRGGERGKESTCREMCTPVRPSTTDNCISIISGSCSSRIKSDISSSIERSSSISISISVCIIFLPKAVDVIIAVANDETILYSAAILLVDVFAPIHRDLENG